MRDEFVIAALKSWQALNERISQMAEDELKHALNVEMTYDRREQMLVRLHARYTRVRAQREREELVALAK